MTDLEKVSFLYHLLVVPLPLKEDGLPFLYHYHLLSDSVYHRKVIVIVIVIQGGLPLSPEGKGKTLPEIPSGDKGPLPESQERNYNQ
jgi:hypothetical protein